MKRDKICKYCGEIVDTSKNGFIVAKDEYEENYIHLSCFRETEAKQLKDALMEDIDDNM